MEPLFEKLKKEGIANPQRLVLPESTEERNMIAADRMLAEGTGKITFIGKKDEIIAKANEMNLPNICKATFVDNEYLSKLGLTQLRIAETEKYAQLFYELRKSKGITIEDARAKAKNPLYLGCLLVKAGEADGMVSGAIHATSDVLRPAFQVLKTAAGENSVSGAFIIVLPEEIAKKYGEKGMLVFADCAVMPDPTEDELAQTAVLTARTAQNLAGITPRVAMLSFSTKGSAQHDKVTKMVNATAKAKALDPSIVIDGELQADAAIVDSVAQLKAPGSPVAGKATVLVFPNLEVGNIAYKLVQRLGGATAVGPILQGLAAPVNDLSRGCNADEIYKTLLITSNQAINRK